MTKDNDREKRIREALKALLKGMNGSEVVEKYSLSFEELDTLREMFFKHVLTGRIQTVSQAKRREQHLAKELPKLRDLYRAKVEEQKRTIRGLKAEIALRKRKRELQKASPTKPRKDGREEVRVGKKRAVWDEQRGRLVWY